MYRVFKIKYLKLLKKPNYKIITTFDFDIIEVFMFFKKINFLKFTKVLGN